MDVPEMTNLHKKKSLTGKNKKNKQTIKNVVVDPFKSYWPLVGEKSEELKKILDQCLPRIKPVKINVPWRLLENVPKDERKTVRKKYIKQHGSAVKITKEDGNLIFGVNEVTKLLESDSCSCVLVANVEPRKLVAHVIEMAVHRSIPVLVVPKLKNVLKRNCGLESLALAIKKGVDESSSLARIVQTVEEISQDHPLTTNHVNATRSKISQNAVETKVNVKKFVDTKNEQHDMNNCHLIKTSANSRVFVPELFENVKDNVNTEVSNKFENAAPSITSNSIFDMANEAVKRKKAKKHVYKPLVVKRLKGKKANKTKMK